MEKLLSWIKDKWFWLRFWYLWRQLDQEEHLEWLRELRYTVWKQRMDPAKISPYHE